MAWWGLLEVSGSLLDAPWRLRGLLDVLWAGLRCLRERSRPPLVLQ